MGLNARQEAFVTEFLKCRNGAEAARRAGYAPRSARVQASVLLTNPNIAAKIKRRTEEAAMGEDEVLGRLADQARGTIEDFISFNLGPYPTFTLDLDKARERGRLHLVKKLKYNSEGYPEIELYSAQDALVQLGKNLGLFVDKADITLHGGLTFTADEAAQAQRELDQWKQQKLSATKSSG